MIRALFALFARPTPPQTMMSEYGVVPPVLMGGILKTYDTVVVGYDFQLSPPGGD